MKRPSFQFYPADWRKDAALQSCSLSARGLWHEMMCLMHECEPYGHLSVNGKPMRPAQVARLVGVAEKEYQKLLAELEDAGVPSVADDGSIYSRRMVRDEHIRNVRAEAGKKGGNPNLVSNKVKQKDNQPPNQTSKQSPTPSSSSSSSKEKDITAAASLAHAPAHEQAPTPPPLDGDKTPDEKALAVAVWLRRREKDRGKQPRGTQANDPRIAAWIEAGVTGLQIAEAYALAVLDRDATDDPGPIGPGFLDIFVAKVLHPPTANSAVNGKRPAPADPLIWATTASGITAKGAEFGIVQEAGEIFPAFKARVHAAAGITDADRARLLADYQVRI